MIVNICYLTRENQLVIKEWYNKPWKIVLKPTNKDYGFEISQKLYQNYQNHIGFENDYKMIQSLLKIQYALNENNLLKVIKGLNKFNILTIDKYTLFNDRLSEGDILISEDKIAIVIDVKENFEPKENTKIIGTLISNEKNIPVFNGPGFKYQQIGKILKKNTIINLLGIMDNNWYKIEWNNYSKYGYVFNKNNSLFKKINILEEKKISSTVNYVVSIIKDKTAIKSNPKNNSSVIGYLEKNKKVKIIKEISNWGLLQSGIGWILLADTQKVD